MHADERRVCPKSTLSSKALAASLLIHLSAFSCVLFGAIPPPRPEVREVVVDVEIVRLPGVTSVPAHDRTPSTKATDAKRASPTDRPTAPSSLPVESPPANGEPASVKPQHMLSQNILADRRSSHTRKVLSQLAPAEQVEQLCNLEAMAQLGLWNTSLRPDRVIAYAMASTQFDGTSFSAEGAALHSRDDWYGLKFKCDLTPDGQKVVAFEFFLGAIIPKRDWQEFGLPDESGPSD